MNNGAVLVPHSRRFKLIATAFAIACLLLYATSFPSTSRAGQYTVVDDNLPAWQAAWTTGSFPYGVFSSGNAVVVQATTTTGGEAWWQSPALPPELNIDSAAFVVNGNDGASAIQGHMRTCFRQGLNGGASAGCGTSQVSYFPGTANNASASVGCGSSTFQGGCAAVRFTVLSTKPAAYGGYSVSGLTATITDNSAPYSVTKDPGYPLNSAGTNWIRGSLQGGTSAYDNYGGGIKTQSIYVDGAEAVSRISACDYGKWVPCPVSSGWAPTLDTTQLPDGIHSLQYRASDAGDNVKQGAQFNLKSDNTKPTTPIDLATSAGTAGWSSVNDFDVTWTNGPEVAETLTQSGIGAVRLDIEPTDSGQIDPGPVDIPVGGTVDGISATTNTLEGLTLPEAGVWRLRLALIDRAGNASDVGDGGAGAPDSDLDIGFDPNPPASPHARANGWISRSELSDGYDQEWNYSANPGMIAPICGFAGKISGLQGDDPGTAINIPGDVRKWRLPTNLVEATHWINLRAVNCAGQASAVVESVQARVDLTDPIGTVVGVENSHWYRTGKNVGLAGTDALSGMAPSSTFSVKEGAYLEYSVDQLPSQYLPGGEGQFSVDGEGPKQLSFSAVDLAGNKAPPQIVKFGIDGTTPTGHFEARKLENPRLIRAAIGDGLSGVALAIIDVRPQVGGEWTSLPTALADLSGNQVGGHPTSAIASATFPDTSMPTGTYVGRIRVYDQAGNELVTSRDANGNTFTLENPMREGASISAGLSKAKRRCGKKRGTKCVRRYRGKVVFTGTFPSLSVGYKRGAVVQGFLTNTKLDPLQREPVEIYTQVPGQREVLAGATSTRSDGSYLFKLRPGMSRTVRVVYPGNDLRQDAAATVKLGTGAKLTLRVSKRHARTGQTVTFRGAVTSYDRSVPASGKIVALQFYAAKRWRPAVAIAHTDNKGRFSVRYRFDGNRVKARIVFRVIAPTEDGWNHSASASKRLTMRVN